MVKRTVLLNSWKVTERTSDPILVGRSVWNRFGIRDPSFLNSADGSALKVNGTYIIYFNGRDKPVADGGVTRVGRATSKDLVHFQVDEPFSVADGTYAAQGSVLFNEGFYRMYYSRDTTMGFRVAESEDGLQWRVFGETGLILSDFRVTRMGLPFVIKYRANWVMVFEGIRDGRFAIFGASSHDGLRWSPIDSEPLYRPTVTTAWDGAAQANPSLFVWRDRDSVNRLYLLYNGYSSPYEWDIGILESHVDGSLSGWSGFDAALMVRGPYGRWDSARLEGARALQTTSVSEHLDLLYFGLPTLDSYRGGAIGRACLRRDDSLPKDGFL